MIEILPLRLEHLELLEPDPVFADVMDGLKIAPLLTMGNGVSLIDMVKGEVLACYGYVLRRPSVYWMWVLPSRRGSRNLIRMVRHFERWFATLPGGTRVECSVHAQFLAGIRFVKAVGFQQETPDDQPAKLFDGRNDCHLFSRCTEPVSQGLRGFLKDLSLLTGRGHDRICAV